MKRWIFFLALFLVGCKFHLVKWKELEIKYLVQGAAEGLVVERLKDHGWVWELESTIKRGSSREFLPGKMVIHIDYWNKTGYRLINNVRLEVPEKELKKISWWKALKASDFKGLVKIYLKKGYKKAGEINFLGRKCLVLKRERLGNLSLIYLWKELPFNMPLYRLEKSGDNYFEKKAIEIKEVK